MNLPRKLIHKTTILFLLAALASGCATTVNLPLTADETYPGNWPGIGTAGSQCADIAGTYYNIGIRVDEKGNQTPVMLTSLLEFKQSYREDLWNRAKSVILSYQPVKQRKNGGTRGTLYVFLNGDKGDPEFIKYANDFTQREVLYKSSCREDVLYAWERNQGGGGAAPMPMAFGGWENLWLTRTSDGSLLARIRKQSMGWIVIFPYYSESFFWAIFRRVEEP